MSESKRTSIKILCHLLLLVYLASLACVALFPCLGVELSDAFSCWSGLMFSLVLDLFRWLAQFSCASARIATLFILLTYLVKLVEF